MDWGTLVGVVLGASLAYVIQRLLRGDDKALNGREPGEEILITEPVAQAIANSGEFTVGEPRSLTSKSYLGHTAPTHLGVHNDWSALAGLESKSL